MIDQQRRLHEAASQGNSAILRALIEEGANIELPGRYGQRALHFASFNDHGEALNVLLEAGADMESRDHLGRTGLIGASTDNHLEAIKQLLLQGADTGARDDLGLSALHWAARHNHPDAIKLLLEHDAPVMARDTEGNTALMWACGLDVARMLLAREEHLQECKNDLAWTPLINASRAGHMEIVQLLLERNVERDTIDGRGCSALSWACSCGHTQIVRLLCEHDSKDDTIVSDTRGSGGSGGGGGGGGSSNSKMVPEPRNRMVGIRTMDSNTEGSVVVNRTANKERCSYVMHACLRRPTCMHGSHDPTARDAAKNALKDNSMIDYARVVSAGRSYAIGTATRRCTSRQRMTSQRWCDCFLSCLQIARLPMLRATRRSTARPSMAYTANASLPAHVPSTCHIRPSGNSTNTLPRHVTYPHPLPSRLLSHRPSHFSSHLQWMKLP